MARGEATATSDLDITVLIDGAPAPYRESLTYAGWPVETFVHTEASIAHYIAKDVERRRKTMPSLLVEQLLLDVDGGGERLSASARRTIEDGPRALTREEMEAKRYSITDLLDDLGDARTEVERVAIATTLWTSTLDLFLVAQRRWTGGGKWLARLVHEVDCTYAQHAVDALDAALHLGNVTSLARLADETLAPYGGRLWEGYSADGESPGEISPGTA